MPDRDVATGVRATFPPSRPCVIADLGGRAQRENAKSAAHVIKTFYLPHGGKMSISRVLAGEFADSVTVMGAESEAPVRGCRSRASRLERGAGRSVLHRPFSFTYDTNCSIWAAIV